MGFFDGLLERTQNPLFLGGLNLMMGGGPQGMMQGMQVGGQMQEQARKRQQEQARAEALKGALGGMQLSPQEQQYLAADTEAGSGILQRILAERLDPMAGIKKKTAEATLKQTELENQLFPLKQQKMMAEISQASEGGDQFGKTGTIVQGADGKFYSVQFGANGKKLVEPLAMGDNAMTPARGVDVVGDQMYDKATGAPMRNVSGNIAGAETAKVVGRETGEGRIGLPKAQRSLEAYEAQSSIVDNEIDNALKLAKGASTTGFVGSGAKFIPGTSAYDLGQKLLTIKANVGFDKLQEMRDNSPTGGALGQVAVQEMQALQAVFGSLDQAQSQGELANGLNQIKAIRAKFRGIRRKAHQQDIERFGAASVPNPETSGAPSVDKSGWSIRRLD